MSDNHDLFDEYERGLLSTEKRTAFEKELAENDELKKAFDQYIEQVNLLKAIGIRDEVATFFDEKEERKTKRIPLRYILPLAVAAAISLILIFRPASLDQNALFERHFSPYPDAITGRATPLSVAEAMQLYNSGQYEKAMRAFNTLELSDTVSFYKGMSHLALKDAKSSIQAFAQIPKESLFYSPSLWYKGLAFLLSEQMDSTRLYMLKIKPNN